MAFVAALALAGSVIGSPTASATPYVGVTAEWYVSFGYYESPSGQIVSQLPLGIAISCFGTASSNGEGCRDSLSLGASVDTTTHLAVSDTSGLVVTNNVGAQLAGWLVFNTDFSAFNPGGPEIGIGVDDPLTQSASFSSSVSGPGVGDYHSCTTTDPVGYNGGGYNFAPGKCGVSSPDSSQDQFGISLDELGVAGSEPVQYIMNIAADFSIPPANVPEPPSIAIIAAPILLLCFEMRRRRKAATPARRHRISDPAA
jgi:hypothetical protein